MEKPLITVLLIGKFKQPVIYEGMHKLCFSCGQIGHQKEICPHTVRSVCLSSWEEAKEVVKAQGSPRERHVVESAEITNQALIRMRTSSMVLGWL